MDMPRTMPAARGRVAFRDASGQGVGVARYGASGHWAGWPGDDASGCDTDTTPTRAVVYQTGARARVVDDSDTR